MFEPLNSKDTKSNFGDVKIVNSEHVIVGNQTIIHGPVYLTHAVSTIQQENIVNKIFLDVSTHHTEGKI